MPRKPRRYSRKLERYCYLRYRKAKTKQAALFWLNRHIEVGDLLSVTKYG